MFFGLWRESERRKEAAATSSPAAAKEARRRREPGREKTGPGLKGYIQEARSHLLFVSMGNGFIAPVPPLHLRL